jgi:hypothetical protein
MIETAWSVPPAARANVPISASHFVDLKSMCQRVAANPARQRSVKREVLTAAAAAAAVPPARTSPAKAMSPAKASAKSGASAGGGSKKAPAAKKAPVAKKGVAAATTRLEASSASGGKFWEVSVKV